MKRLAVTADDFGLDRKLDEGIRLAFTEGIVTHVSLVANGDAFEEAVSFLKKHTGIIASAHLNLTDGRPLSHHKDIQRLLNSEGNFLGSHWRVVWILLRVTDLFEAVEMEYRMQIERILSAGIKIWQLNCHGHLHALPAVFRLVVQLALSYKIPYVRVVQEYRGLKVSLLSAGFRMGRWQTPKARRIQLNGCLGVSDSGHLDEKRLREILRRRPEGFSELICHPGRSDKNLEARYPWNYHWEKELALLTSTKAKNLIKRFL